MNGANDRELGLAEVLESLGEDLREANERAAANGVATLAWAEATVELALEVKATAKGGIKFAVLGLGGEGGAERARGRTVRAQVHCVPAARLLARSDTGDISANSEVRAGEVRGQVVGVEVDKIG
jgi:hypothetical protein